MTTGGTHPLSVDPEELSAAGGALLNSARELPSAPAPFNRPIATQLPLIQTQATGTAQNVVNAAHGYAEPDAERAAEAKERTDTEGGQRPSRHRAAEADDRIEL